MHSLPQELTHEIYNHLRLPDQAPHRNRWPVTKSPALPQELLDEIVSFLHQDDKESLRNCSLVARSWVYASQKGLFEYVKTHTRELGSWLHGVSQKNPEILRHVLHLNCENEDFGLVWPNGSARDTIRGCLGSLRRLRRFDWYSTEIILSPQEIELFSAFKHTLSYIGLWYCSISRNMLVHLINYFPNLGCLRLELPIYMNSDDEETTLSSQIPLKKLYIDEVPGSFLRVLEELSRLGLCFNDITLYPVALNLLSTVFANFIVRTFGTRAQCLRLPEISRCGMYSLPGISSVGTPGHNFLLDLDDLDLSSCLQLRELELELEASASPLRDWGMNVISSVASTSIERIIIKRSVVHDSDFREVDDTFWTRLDDILVGLVERPEYMLRLEVEFRGNWNDRRYGQSETPLPRFVKKGRMTVRNRRNLSLVYCSDEPGESVWLIF